MPLTVADVVKAMESIAPASLAEHWDNVGLQVGQSNWPVQRVWVALDPLPGVMEAAVEKNVDFLITHHPLIFEPLGAIDFSTGVGSVINLASQNRIAVFSAHTNLDSAVNGINDVLAFRLGLNKWKILGEVKQTENYKLVVFVPGGYEQKFLNLLFENKAGKIGAYKCCSFISRDKGTFKPESEAKPFIGQTNKISHVNEVRIETVVKKNYLGDIIDHLKKIHPYETMAYDVYPLTGHESKEGIGRIGKLEERMELKTLALSVKKKLGLGTVKISRKADLPVKRVAICGGSGSSLMKHFLSSDAEVYISGDFRYHDARAVEALNKGLIDIGHFASEHLIVDNLTERLQKTLSETGMDIQVEGCRIEKDPFVFF